LSPGSALQRARAHLAAVGPTEDGLAEPTDPARRALVDRYAAAFEQADVAALTRLLRDDVRLEMPPLRAWFSGRAAVATFLGSRVLTAPGVLRMVPVGANGQPALAAYRDDRHVYAHALHVLEVGDDAVSAITVFLGADLFGPFGLPTALP
jgi:RNA polymerase sigma-70 factor, ECF subfamily